MLQITAKSTIYFASIHIDFRKGIDGIIAICRNQLTIEPMDGAFFLFYNRRKTAIKILSYDGQGFWLCSKRLSKGSFEWDLPTNEKPLSAKQICHKMLTILLYNGSGAKFAKDWRPL